MAWASHARRRTTSATADRSGRGRTALDGKRVRASRTIGVSHISSRYPGSVEVNFDVGASTLHSFAGAASVPSGRPSPVRVSCALTFGRFTSDGDGAMMAPARRCGAAVLQAGIERAASSDAPRRPLGMALSAPLVMPSWHELDRYGRASGPSRHAAAAPFG